VRHPRLLAHSTSTHRASCVESQVLQRFEANTTLAVALEERPGSPSPAVCSAIRYGPMSSFLPLFLKKKGGAGSGILQHCIAAERISNLQHSRADPARFPCSRALPIAVSTALSVVGNRNACLVRTAHVVAAPGLQRQDGGFGAFGNVISFGAKRDLNRGFTRADRRLPGGSLQHIVAAQARRATHCIVDGGILGHD
jgi:hypothetical protein